MAYRLLTPSDRDAYLQMVHAFYHSDAVLHPIPDTYAEATFDELMRADTYARAYLLEHDGQTAGYALLAITFSQEAGGIAWWVEELYVKELFRGKGIGSGFLKDLISAAPPEVKRIRLEVEEDNTRAVALYRSLGFEALEYGQMVLER
ncbi:MAG: GNAT family N-acetyltransferase [Clostridia bacterium]|nr:GNAT family N-acetyltransferase [Clostridia bacterium]